MVSDKFRRQLRQQAMLWQQEGLIDDLQFRLLAARYQFDELDVGARNRFVMILLGVGSILLALGAITFVAANWQAWSAGFKLSLLLGVMLLADGAGFWLWRDPARSGKRRRLGQGLLMLGALMVGPSMSLMAQMFHLGGSAYELFLCWGLAVWGMAYSLELMSLGIVTFVLVLIGYLWGLPQLAHLETLSWSRLIVAHMPLLSLGGFGVLAYRCRSRALFGLEALLLVGALEVNLVWGFELMPGIAMAIAPILPAALLWAYDDRIWPGSRTKQFQPRARILALVFLCIPVYVLAFRFLWDFSVLHESWDGDGVLVWQPWLDVAVLVALTVVFWLRLLFQWRSWSRTTGLVGGTLAIATLLLVWHHNISPIAIPAIVIFNGLLFLVASSLIRNGLATSKRLAFWGGMMLLTLQILSRLLEYNTGLLFKSFVFFLCGAGVIAAGLWFEKHLTTLAPAQETSP